MPGTFYVPLPRRRPFSGIDSEAPYTTHCESIENSQVEMKPYVPLWIEVDVLVDNHLAYTFSALIREIFIKSPIFDNVGMMLSSRRYESVADLYIVCTLFGRSNEPLSRCPGC